MPRIPQIPQRVALALFLLALLAAPVAAGVKSNVAALLEAAGLDVLSIQKVRDVVVIGDPTAPSAIKVPAQTAMQLVCRIVAGRMDCYQAAIDVCPPDVILSQGETSYRCDLACDGAPDARGQCDCDVRYDTCKPFP